MGKLKHNLMGDVIGELWVIEPAPKSHRGEAMWWCICLNCGLPVDHPIYGSNLRRPGHTTSCGCRQAEITRKRSTKHGLAPRSGQAKEFWAVHGAMYRCGNPNYYYYHRYGGAGIKVCDGIRTVSGLVDAIGLCPPNKTSLGRMNNEGHYSCGSCAQCVSNGWPRNVRWEDWSEQANNTSASVRIDGKTISEIASQTGMTPTEVRRKHGLQIYGGPDTA